MNRLKETREKKGIKQSELASLLNVSQATLSNWERNVHEPDSFSLIELSKILNVSIDYLLNVSPIKQIERHKGIKIPVLGKIPAGIPIEAIEDVLDYEEIPEDWGRGGKEYFALKVEGDSMSPKYLEDDVVIFLETNKPNNGSDCAVIINGDEATFKRVLIQEKGIVLQPINTDGYEPVFYSNKQCHQLPVRIIGIAKEIRRKI